jgi:hypothetical protein
VRVSEENLRCVCYSFEDKTLVVCTVNSTSDYTLTLYLGPCTLITRALVLISNCKCKHDADVSCGVQDK